MAKKHNWQRRGNSATLHVCIGTDYRGKPNRFSKTVPYTTDNKVDKEWEKFYQDCLSGKATKKKKMSITQMTDIVMDELIIPSCKRTTIRGYRAAQKKIRETIGKRQAADVKPMEIQMWVNDLAKELSAKTVKNYYSFLRKCYKTMVLWEQLSSDPCKYIRLPKVEKKEMQIINKEDLQDFLIALDTIPKEQYDYKVAILLALFGGLRRAEICGLYESDVDFENGCVNIVRTLNCDANGPFEDTPKTKSSVRTVYYPKEIMDEIRRLILFHKELRLKLGSQWRGSTTRLLHGYLGADLYPDNLWHYLDRFLKEHGMKHISFHALRHTYTSMLADLDKPLAQISKQLGHSQQTTTLNIYSHFFKDIERAKKDTADELSNTFLQQIYNK